MNELKEWIVDGISIDKKNNKENKIIWQQK